MGGPMNGGNLTGIIIPTMLQTSSDFLQYWTGMTCLYDPLWVAEKGKRTLPIAFFQITSIKEIGRTTVSKKRVMLYEPQSDASDDGLALSKKVRPSVLRAIADNAVRDPKEYMIQAILPYQPLGRFVSDGLSFIGSTISTFLAILGWDDNELVRTCSNIFSAATAATNAFQTVADTVAKLATTDGVTYINKNSLEAMWESSHFLCMKMWTGYDYKYVMITNIEIDKKGTEDDVFRLSMQLQEVPVLTITKPRAPKAGDTDPSLLSKVLGYESELISSALTTVTGVANAVKKEGA